MYYGRSASAVWAMGYGLPQRRKTKKGNDGGLHKLSQGKEKIEYLDHWDPSSENKITFPVQILNHFKVCPLLFLEFGFGVPVVTVVVEGGLDALKAVKESVKYGIPSVVVDGTRRAADILAFAHNNCECERQVKIRVVQSQRRSIYCF